MSRSAYNDPRGSSNIGTRAVHTDLHFDDGSSTTRPNQSYSTPPSSYPPPATGHRPSSRPLAQQNRPPQSELPPQWTPEPSHAITSQRFEAPAQPASHWPQNDFFDMPEPEPFRWNVNDDVRRVSSPPTLPYRPLETLPASLTAGLPKNNSPPPPPLPPKTAAHQPQRYSGSPPPLDHEPYPPPKQRYSLPHPQKYSAPPTSFQVDGPGRRPTPPQQQPYGRRRSSDLYYNPDQPRPVSHSGPPQDTIYSSRPSQRPSSSHAYHSNGSTPPNLDPRYSYDPGYSGRPPNTISNSPPPPANSQRPQPSPYRQSQQPQQNPQQHYQNPRPPYQPPPPNPDPQRRTPPGQGPPRHQPPPKEPIWRPTPPPPRRAPGPVISNPPSTSLTSLKHLPYQPILYPPYHRETADHPQHFSKSNLLRILIIPAESTTFLAGTEVYGRMDVICKADGSSKGKSELLVGELGIELMGYDETKAESSTRSHVFLLSRRIFQSPFNKGASVDKVTSAIAFPTTVLPDEKGYRNPEKGTTIFPFRFQIPVDAGSAVECGTDARTRYTLTGYAKVRISGSFETVVQSVEVDVAEQLPYDHIYRNPYYKPEKVSAKSSTDKSFRGKSLTVEISVPKGWYKAGETTTLSVELTSDGFKKVGWVKAILINRVTIKPKSGEGKEVVLDYPLIDERIEDDTEFDPDKPSVTRTLGLKIPNTCRTVSTGLFDIKQYIKVFVLHNVLNVPFSLSLPMIDILHPASVDAVTNEGETYASLVTKGYTVRELDVHQSGEAKIIRERPGTNFAVPWDWYVDKGGRNKILQ